MTSAIHLRDVQEDDVPLFFQHQRDEEANWMAAFTAQDPTDRQAFMAHWARIMADKNVLIKTILLGDEVVGSVLSYVEEGDPEVSYWIDKAHWGKGIVTQALGAFLQLNPARPIYARVAKDNIGSLRVLQKCGFIIIGEDKGYANARQTEVVEYLLELKAADQSRDE